MGDILIDNFETKTSCPICQADLIIKWQRDNIPYFGDIMYTTANCGCCSYRFADTMILASKEPSCCELPIRTLADLDARVIRSTSGTILIEELGIMVEPGPISESYITNAEGVLLRIRSVVESTIRWSEDDPKKQEIGRSLLKKLDEIIENPENASTRITLAIKDPLGNSTIISAAATSRPLTDEEKETLKTGMIILDTEKDQIIHDISEEAGPIGKQE